MELLRLQRLRNESQEFWLLVNNSLDQVLLQGGWKEDTQVNQSTWAMAAMTQAEGSCNSGCGSKETVSAAVIKAKPVSVSIIGPFPLKDGARSRLSKSDF